MSEFCVNMDMFGSYVKIPTDRSGAMHVYKVVSKSNSNGYCDIPFCADSKPRVHNEIVPILFVIHCGIDETNVQRVALSDCELEQNEALTLNELREMDGEKIYVHYIDGFYTDEDGAYFGKFEQLVRDCDGKLTACSLPLEYYNKTWTAYRHKYREV